VKLAQERTRGRSEMLSADPNSNDDGGDHNKIHFKLGRFAEFDVNGKEAIHAGKPYIIFGVAYLSLIFLLLLSIQAVTIRHLITLFIG
jgi:hypothetical protein